MAMAGASTATSVASAHLCTLRCPSIWSRHQSHAVAASSVLHHVSHLTSSSSSGPKSLLLRCSKSSLSPLGLADAEFKIGKLAAKFAWRNFSLRDGTALKAAGFGAGKEGFGSRVLWTQKFSVSMSLAETEISKEQKNSAVGAEKGKFALSVPAFQKRLRIAEIKGGPDEGLGRVGEKMTVRGWVRTCRLQKTFTFVEVNDGSCLSNLQAVVQNDVEGYDAIESGLVTTGASVALEGELIESQGAKQKVELKATKLILISGSDATTFPVQTKKLTREYLRTIAHMRPRTNTFGAVARVRNALAYATHQFFQEKRFVWVASPIITASDCEGAGEQFCVTTLIPTSHLDPTTKVSDIPATKDGSIDWSQVGELIGGSQREERLDKLEARIEELGLNEESYWWYLDRRRYGTGKE